MSRPRGSPTIWLLGAIAQLGERAVCIREVAGSSPAGSIGIVGCFSHALALLLLAQRGSGSAEPLGSSSSSKVVAPWGPGSASVRPQGTVLAHEDKGNSG